MSPPKAKPARELTEKEAEAVRASAFQMELQIKKVAVHVHEAWWVMAELLYEFHEKGYWAHLNYDSLDEFLAQPEIGISRSQFFRMNKMWRDLVVVKELPTATLKELEPSKVREVVPAIMRGDVEPEDALDDCAGLSYRDVRKKYRPEEAQKHGQKADDSKPLAAEDEPVAVQCDACGSWYFPEETLDGEVVADEQH